MLLVPTIEPQYMAVLMSVKSNFHLRSRRPGSDQEDGGEGSPG